VGHRDAAPEQRDGIAGDDHAERQQQEHEEQRRRFHGATCYPR
jgi:hypothetical protein